MAFVSSRSGSEFEKSKEPLVDRVVKYYTDNYGGGVKRDGFGVVFLDKRGVKDSISHGFGRNKAAAFAAVPEIIKNGALIDYKENWKGRGLDGHTIVAPVKIGNDGFVGVVVITRGKGTNRNKFYLHEVVLQKNLQEESFKTDTKADSHQGDIAKLMQKIFSTKEKTEKIAENGGNLYIDAEMQSRGSKSRYNEGENEESKKVFDQAKKLFGTTRDVREAGYVLPDGSMLDFSGRHLMNPGSDTSFLRGRRSLDHRDIQQVAYERDGNAKTGIKTDMERQEKSKLLIAFEKKNSAPDNTTDTGETLKEGKQNGTATLRNTVSSSKGKDYNLPGKENREKRQKVR